MVQLTPGGRYRPLWEPLHYTFTDLGIGGPLAVAQSATSLIRYWPRFLENRRRMHQSNNSNKQLHWAALTWGSDVLGSKVNMFSSAGVCTPTSDLKKRHSRASVITLQIQQHPIGEQRMSTQGFVLQQSTTSSQPEQREIIFFSNCYEQKRSETLLRFRHSAIINKHRSRLSLTLATSS